MQSKVDELKAEAAPGSAPRTARHAQLPLAWAVFAGLVGPAIIMACTPLEPAPADPNAPLPLIEQLIWMVLLVAWIGAAITAAKREPRALTWATVVGGLSVALAISCPLSGHHTSIGMWWVAEFVICGAAFAAAIVGHHLYRHRASA